MEEEGELMDEERWITSVLEEEDAGAGTKGEERKVGMMEAIRPESVGAGRSRTVTSTSTGRSAGEGSLLLELPKPDMLRTVAGGGTTHQRGCMDTRILESWTCFASTKAFSQGWMQHFDVRVKLCPPCGISETVLGRHRIC